MKEECTIVLYLSHHTGQKVRSSSLQSHESEKLNGKMELKVCFYSLSGPTETFRAVWCHQGLRQKAATLLEKIPKSFRAYENFQKLLVFQSVNASTRHIWQKEPTVRRFDLVLTSSHIPLQAKDGLWSWLLQRDLYTLQKDIRAAFDIYSSPTNLFEDKKASV